LYQRKEEDGKDNAHVPRNQVTILSLQTLASLWIGKNRVWGTFSYIKGFFFSSSFLMISIHLTFFTLTNARRLDGHHGLHAYEEKGEQTCSRMIFKETKKHKHL
jgi:hypothetical protein